MMCPHLMVQAHQALPLHQIEVSKPEHMYDFVLIPLQSWNGCYFALMTLKELGLCVQIGHNGTQCPVPVTE